MSRRIYEEVDPEPIELPLRYKHPPTITEQIKRHVETALSRHALEQGFESFEEAEDFDVDDDFDPSSPWELEFDPVSGKEMYPQEKALLDKARQEFQDLDKKQKKQRFFDWFTKKKSDSTPETKVDPPK